MAEYDIEIDEAHELMLDQMTDDGADREQLLSGFAEQAIYNTYQQMKQEEANNG